MHKMRHIATARDSSVFLTAEFEDKIYSWDLNTYERISEFNSVLDFGGQRLAISGDGTKCVAASYSGRGISMYDVSSGSEIWCRKDIKKIQFITFDSLNETLYVGVEDMPLLILKLSDGEDEGKMKSITEVYFDLLSSKRLLLKGRRTIILDDFCITSPTFAFLDIQGVGKGIVMSAVSNDLMYYDYNENTITWRISPKDNEHFIKIAFSEKNKIIYAVLYKYNEPRKPPYYLLYAISKLDGAIQFVYPLPTEACEFGFAQKATRLICSCGDVFDISLSEPKLVYSFNWI